MTQELSVEEAHEQRSQLQYAKYRFAGKNSTTQLNQKMQPIYIYVKLDFVPY